LSASTFTTLFKNNIPVVLTLHDFFPLSPSRNFLIGEHLDEQAYKPTFKCIYKKCINNRLAPSVAGVLEAYYYKWKKIWKKVDVFVCPSQFMADKMVEWGYPKEKMRVVRNPFELKTPEIPLGNSIVFLGRIHAEKGIKIFMEAVKNLPDYQVIIAGTGPDDVWVDNFIKENKLTNIKRWGWVSKEELPKLMGEAKIIAVPSIFYENCPVTILEALSFKRVVVASDRGGNSELVIDGKTGFLCKPEDVVSLQNMLKRLMDSPDEILNKVASEGKKLVERNHGIKEYVDCLEQIYGEIV
jgi:glycosyltransferase involved in cell wall biosynthesis